MTTAWLMLAAGENRQHGGNDGYDDDPARRYSWDDTVSNHRRPSAGDYIALWDTVTLLGVSVIERIVEADTEKTRLMCPHCEQTRVKEREHKQPRFRCYNKKCRRTFNSRKPKQIPVHTYSTEHATGWVDLEGRLNASKLRALCLKEKSIQSIRELNWTKFIGSLSASDAQSLHGVVETTSASIAGGFRTRNGPVRVRIGQRAFRLDLLNRFGSVCAFTGAQPDSVLDAAHLYSYAAEGKHHDHGGVLLRKDLHRLFDLGLLVVNPDSRRIDVHPSLELFPEYQKLHGEKLVRDLNDTALRWLKSHWTQHRG